MENCFFKLNVILFNQKMIQLTELHYLIIVIVYKKKAQEVDFKNNFTIFT